MISAFGIDHGYEVSKAAALTVPKLGMPKIPKKVKVPKTIRKHPVAAGAGVLGGGALIGMAGNGR